MQGWSRSWIVATALVVVTGFATLFLAARALLPPIDSTPRHPPSTLRRHVPTALSTCASMDAIGVQGDCSPMQLRLVAGDNFRRLLAQLRNGDITEAAGQEAFSMQCRQLLSVEKDNSHRVARMGLKAALQDVVNRGFDTATLQLQAVASPTSQDDGFLVRVWSPHGLIPSPAIERATALIRTLDGIANTESTGGFDVLGEDNLARDRVRPAAFPSWAAGVFVPADDLSIVDTRWGGRSTEYITKHELVHAWKRRHRPKWKRRFVSEGLSKFLERAEVDAEGLTLDLYALRHNFRRLLLRVDLWNEKDQIAFAPNLRALVTCSPRAFYGMYRITYPLSQALFAYLGMDPVMQAVAQNDEDMLVDALSSIAWPDFYRFLQTHAAEGDAAKAWWVNEATLDPDVAGGISAYERSKMFRAAGIPRDEAPRAPQTPRAPRRARRVAPRRVAQPSSELSRSDAQFRVGASIRDVPTLADVSNRSGLVQLGALLNDAAHVGRLGLVSEASRAMRQVTVYRDAPVGIFAPAPDQMPRTVFGVHVVERYLAALQAIAPSMPVKTYRVAKDVTQGSLPFGKEGVGPSLASLGTWLLKGADKADAVVIVLATSNTSAVAKLHEALVERDAAWQQATPAQRLRGAALLLSEAFTGTGPRPAGVLLVDVGAGKSDAAIVAMALSMAWRGQTQVGYWDPSAE